MSRKQKFYSNVGDTFINAFGVKFFLFVLLLKSIGAVISIGATGPRLYLRKRQGVGVLGFLYLKFILYLLLCALVIIIEVKNVLLIGSQEAIAIVSENKPVMIYMLGLVVCMVSHWFKDFQPQTLKMESDPYYLGNNIISPFIKRNYLSVIYSYLVDPVILLVISSYFYFSAYGRSLGIILIIGSICVFIETLMLIWSDWKNRLDTQSVEVMSAHYGSGNTSNYTENENIGVPRIIKRKRN